jgi:DNA-binding MarR family transcriptional regulator
MLVYCSSRLRYRFDQRLAEDDLTSQQGVLLTVVRTRGKPKLGEVATAMATSHQNAKQIAAALERKGMLRIVKDADDARARRLTITDLGIEAWKTRDAGDFRAIGSWLSDMSRAISARCGTYSNVWPRLFVTMHASLIHDAQPIWSRFPVCSRQADLFKLGWHVSKGPKLSITTKRGLFRLSTESRR